MGQVWDEAATDTARLRERHELVTEQAREVVARARELIEMTSTAPWHTAPGPAELRKEIESLHAAMASRATIEQAKGIVMASMRCTPDEAFEILVQQSQHTNRKLRDVARDLVEDTSHPPAPR